MTLGMSSFTADGFLNALGNATAFSVAQVYMKLHLGDPGAAGATTPATETIRKAVSFGVAGANTGVRQIANDAEIVWTNIAGSEDCSHFSLWDTVGPAGGNYLGSGTITANGFTAGDSYRMAVGAAVVSLPIAA